MAANLASMFGQLNNTIRQNPLAQRPNNTVPGMAERGVDTVNPMLQGAMKGLTGALGGDSEPLQTSKEAYGAGMQALKAADLSTPEGLTQAAGIYQQLGMQEQALQLLEKAEVKKQALAAKDNARLDAANASVQEELARKQKKSQKFQAAAIARNNGDKAAVTGILSGAIDPGAYLTEVIGRKKPENKTLADGAMLIGPNGEVLAHNPKDPTGSGDLTATMQKRLNAADDSYFEATALVNEYDSMLGRIDQVDLTGGLIQSAETMFNRASGRRDDDDFFRTQAIKLKNAEAIGHLPKGPASDRDIEIVMRGFPPDNANKEEIREFLEASKRVATRVAEFNKAKAEHISEFGDERNFLSAWDSQMESKAREEFIQDTPPVAIEALQANPELRDQFLAKYKWLPEGF